MSKQLDVFGNDATARPFPTKGLQLSEKELEIIFYASCTDQWYSGEPDYWEWQKKRHQIKLAFGPVKPDQILTDYYRDILGTLCSLLRLKLSYQDKYHPNSAEYQRRRPSLIALIAKINFAKP